MLLLVMSGTSVLAQSTGQASAGQNVPLTELKPLEKQMQGELVCMCGGCKSPLNDCPMLNCHGREAMKAKLHTLVEDGNSHDAIVASFIKEYGGQDVLGAPIDEGFNRLAWLFPYLVGACGAIVVGLTAVRLTRQRPAADGGDAAVPSDPSLDDRLDDELRNLD
jgi:cytochrome c-type biogenesis protein CcmH/NrfF